MTQNIVLTSWLRRVAKAPGRDGVTFRTDSTMTLLTRPRLPSPAASMSQALPRLPRWKGQVKWGDLYSFCKNIHGILYCYTSICHLVCILAWRWEQTRQGSWTASEFHRAVLVSGKLFCNSESGHQGRRSVCLVPWQNEEFWRSSQVKFLLFISVTKPLEDPDLDPCLLPSNTGYSHKIYGSAVGEKKLVVDTTP